MSSVAQPEDRRTLKALTDLLRSGYQAEWAPMCDLGNGVRSWPYAIYDDRVYAGIDAGQRLAGGADQDYLANIKPLKRRPLDRVSLPEAATWLTWLRRGERFVDGHILAFIETGQLLTLLEHLLELVEGESA